MKGDVATALSRGVDGQWKNYTKADFLTCDKQGVTAGQASGAKKTGFHIKTELCIWGSHMESLIQTSLPTHPKISKHQFSAAPHQQCHAAFVGPHMPNLVSLQIYTMGRKTTTFKLAARSPLGMQQLSSDL